MNNILHVGLDIGSTTIKIVVLDESKKILYCLNFHEYKQSISTRILATDYL